MAATSLPVARLLQLRIPIAWQEAVAVAIAAEVRSAADATPITLEQCRVSTDGQVHLASSAAPSTGSELSALQLLSALLEGQAAPKELCALAATAGDALASFPSEREDGQPAHADLRHFVSPHPESEIARLAERGLAAERTAEVASPSAIAGDRGTPLVRTRPRVPIQPALPLRRPGVTGRAQHPSRRIAVGFAVLFVALASGAAAMGALVSGVGWSFAGVSGVAEPRSVPTNSRTGRPTDAEARVPLVAAPPAAFAPFAERAATPSPSMAPASVSPEPGPVTVSPSSSADEDVAPPVLLRPQMPSQPRSHGGQGPPALIELLIDEHGSVQRVRLETSSPSVNDHLILAAAKAWRFRPATRAGQPVPYVLRMPVTR